MDIRQQEDKIYEAAIENWGRSLQISQYFEEVAESTVAINKFQRKVNKIVRQDQAGLDTSGSEEALQELRDDIVEEMADVRVMSGQVLKMFNDPDSRAGYCSDEFQERFKDKLEGLRDKLIERVGEHEVCSECGRECSVPAAQHGKREKPALFCNNYVGEDEDLTWKEQINNDVELIFDEMGPADYKISVSDLKDEVRCRYDDLGVKDSSLTTYVYSALDGLLMTGRVQKIDDGVFMKLADFDLSKNGRKQKEVEDELTSDAERGDFHPGSG